MNQDNSIEGRYQVIKSLDSGTFGKTYLAKDMLGSEQFCTVKKFQPLIADISILEEARRRFELEVIVLEQLSVHDRIPQLLDYFESDRTFYLIQEFIEGQDLSWEVNGSQIWSEEQAISFLYDVLHILRFVHQKKVIHRDIKPSHFVRRASDSNLVLIGFGAIKEIETLFLNSEGVPCASVVGTPGYMAMEHLEGKPRFNSDIYSLGMTAIQALTGVSPFQLYHKQQVHEVNWRYRATVSDEFAVILDKMVRFNFEDRYQDIEEVIEDIKDVKCLQVLESDSKKDGAEIALQLEDYRDLSSIVSSVKFLELDVEIKKNIGRLKESEIQNSNGHVKLENKLDNLTINPVSDPIISIPQPALPEESIPQKKQVIPQPKLTVVLLGTLVIIASLFLWPLMRFKFWANRCNILIDEGQYQGALNLCSKALEIQPNNPQVWKYQGDALSGLERYDAALVAYDKALKNQPNFYQAWNTRGQVMYRLQRHQEALESHETAIAIAPQDSKGTKGRGIALIGLGNYQEALAAFEEAIVTKIDDWQAWEYKGLALEYLQRIPQAQAAYNEAIAILDDRIASQVDEAIASVDRGRILGKLQRQEEALASYEEAIKNQPDFYRAWIGKGSALFFMQRYEEALAAYEEVTKIKPDYYLSWHNQGSMLADGLQQYEEAIASYDKAIELNPSFYPAWRDRGGALMKVGEYERAIASFDKALNINPDDYQSWGNRGIALVQLNRYDEALAAFDKALSINPQDPLAWANKGWALEKANRVTEAIAAYDKAIEIRPNFQPAIAARKKIVETETRSTTEEKSGEK